MIIGTAGHIDHGKTSLVHALTGVDTDRLKEEKARGISIDLGFAYLPAPDGSILGFVDVPGHEKFVHNMVAGATGVDFVLLAVAADDGPMPQTLEHLAIADLLGVKRGVVALTKADLAAGAARGGLSRHLPIPCRDDARGRRDHSGLYRHGRGDRGAAIKLDADATVTDKLCIGEGLETAMTARQIGLRPTWALGSSGAIAAFPVLGRVESLTILAENDEASERATEACGRRWHDAGCDVFVCRPKTGNDLNDALQAMQRSRQSASGRRHAS